MPVGTIGADVGIFLWNGSGGAVSDEEIALAVPDASEAKNLNRHVERCALRYKLFTKRQASQGMDIQQIKYMLFALIGIVIVTSPQVRSFIDWASKFL